MPAKRKIDVLRKIKKLYKLYIKWYVGCTSKKKKTKYSMIIKKYITYKRCIYLKIKYNKDICAWILYRWKSSSKEKV